MNKDKRLGLAIIVLVWLAVFLLPLGFVNNSSLSDSHSLFATMLVPISLLIVFCANFFWLTPRYLMQGRPMIYVLTNAAIIVGLAFITHLTRDHQPDSTPLLADKMSSSTFLIFRDIFNMSVSATVSTAIVFSINWARMTEKRQLAELEKSAMELQLIRHEIHPHFLLNTLNNIYALIPMNREKSQEAVLKLSNLLRYMLYDSKQETIELSKEVEFIKSYIDLMSLRITENVKLTCDIDILQAENMKIVPLIFISTIENAFKHGISPSKESFIHITIKADGKDIQCLTENSYFPKDSNDQSGHGIGQKQTENLLKLYYPDRHVMECNLTENNNTFTTKIIIYGT